VLTRPTTSKFRQQLGWTAGLCFALVSLSASPALASSVAPTTAPCETPKYSQPFTPFNDYNYYVLAPGGEFNSSSEGWTLNGGAQIIQTGRPSAATGGVLDLPGGSQAISPPEPITLDDRTARVWVRNLKGGEGVKVSVSYLNTDSWLRPKDVGHVHGQHSSWTLSEPINTQPQTAGPEEGVRIVRFVFEAGKANETQLFGLWVDPRHIGDSRFSNGTQPACESSKGTLVRGVTQGGSPGGVG